MSSWAGVRRKGNKEEDKERGGLTPFPTLSPYFSAYISLIHPHDLNSWNGLKVIVIFATKSVHVAYFTVLKQTSVLQQNQKSVSSRKLYHHFFLFVAKQVARFCGTFYLSLMFFSFEVRYVHRSPHRPQLKVCFLFLAEQMFRETAPLFC